MPTSDIGHARQLLELHATGHTLRYHTHRMVKDQTVGQHTYGVLMVLLWLTDGLATREQILAALLHDSGERFVGDIPSPTKRKLDSAFKADLDAMEAAELQRHTGISVPETDARGRTLLKLSDWIEGALHCRDEAMLGHRSPALLAMWDRFIEYALELDRSHLTPAQNVRLSKILVELSSERKHFNGNRE